MSEGRQMIRIGAQIEEMDLAARLRETEITRAMQRGSIQPAVAEMHIARLRAGMQTLRWLEANEDRIKAKVAGTSS